MNGQRVVLVEKVVRGKWSIELFSDGKAVLRARYSDRPNYVYRAEWSREEQAVLYSPYDSGYQPEYLFRAVAAVFQRNLAKIGA